MKFTVSEEMKKIILRSMKLINFGSNEQERSIIVIGEIVKAAAFALEDGGVKSEIKAQHIWLEGKKRDFITDLELYGNDKLFHIFEAKGKTGMEGGLEQLKYQLQKTKCRFGAVSDGFLWQFVELVNDKIVYLCEPLATHADLDKIFKQILQTFEN